MTITRLRCAQAGRRRRHRLCGAGSSGGCPTTARDARLDLVLTEREVIDLSRGSVRRKCAFSSSATSSGRSGRNVVLERLPGLVARLEARFRRRQRRERGRRLRHHRGDLQRIDRCRRRRHHARQSCLGPARGAGLHRARAAADPPGQLSDRHARARRRPDRGQERRARARGQRHGPHLHGPARRSVRGDRARACRLSASSARPTPSSSTCIARRPARSRRWAISATAAPASSSAPTPMRRPPTIRSCRAAPPSSPMSA